MLGLSTLSVSAQAQAPADSAKAVHRLFASRRTGSTILGLPAGYFLGYGAVATAQGIDGAPVTLGLGVALSAVTVSKGIRFSKKREEEVVSAYQQGKAIPKNIRRRLKRKHFKA
jgi:hypothetical protein